MSYVLDHHRPDSVGASQHSQDLNHGSGDRAIATVPAVEIPQPQVTGAIQTRSLSLLAYGQTVDILSEGNHSLLVKPHGGTGTFLVARGDVFRIGPDCTRWTKSLRAPRREKGY